MRGMRNGKKNIEMHITTIDDRTRLSQTRLEPHNKLQLSLEPDSHTASDLPSTLLVLPSAWVFLVPSFFTKYFPTYPFLPHNLSGSRNPCKIPLLSLFFSALARSSSASVISQNCVFLSLPRTKPQTSNGSNTVTSHGLSSAQPGPFLSVTPSRAKKTLLDRGRRFPG